MTLRDMSRAWLVSSLAIAVVVSTTAVLSAQVGTAAAMNDDAGMDRKVIN